MALDRLDFRKNFKLTAEEDQAVMDISCRGAGGSSADPAVRVTSTG